MNNIKKTIFKTGGELSNFFTYNFAIGQPVVGLACEEIAFPITLYSHDSTLVVLSVLYTDIGLTMPYNGDSLWYKMGTKAYQITNTGTIAQISIDCSGVLPVETYCYTGRFEEVDTVHVPPGGIVSFFDEYGLPQEAIGLTIESGITNVYSSTVPTVNAGAIQVDCDTGLPL